MESKLSMKWLFNDRGWHLERSILDQDVVVEVREFLASRQQHLRRLFEAWVGTKLDNPASYAWHQRQVPIYEERGIPGDLRHFLVGEFDLETRLDLRIMELLSTERCRKFVSAFLQTDYFYVHYPPMIRFKIANAPSSLVPVHQDFAYNRHMSDFIAVWLPLVPIDNDCGGVIVYEGSHLADMVQHNSSGAWGSKAVADLSRYPRRHILMDAGDALFFPPTLLHESAPHCSSHVRYSIDFRVIRRSADTTKSYYDPFTRSVTRMD